MKYLPLKTAISSSFSFLFFYSFFFYRRTLIRTHSDFDAIWTISIDLFRHKHRNYYYCYYYYFFYRNNLLNRLFYCVKKRISCQQSLSLDKTQLFPLPYIHGIEIEMKWKPLIIYYSLPIRMIHYYESYLLPLYSIT